MILHMSCNKCSELHLYIDSLHSLQSIRVSVEWVFGEIVEYFAFVDFKKNQKIGLQEVGTMYITCALLQNAMTCLYGSSTSTFMGLHPPSLEEYFQ